MLRIQFGRARINPFKILSGVFLLVSPFVSWMTLSAFGYVSNSTLWQITRSETSFPIGQTVPAIALYCGILLIISGLVILKSAKLGVILSAVALIVFGLAAYSSFGIFPGAIPVSILPGTGVFLGLCGMTLGFAALRTRDLPLRSLLVSLSNRNVLGQSGVLASSVFLAADGWSHWSTGDLSDFLGSTLVEGAIHGAMFMGVALLLMVFLVRRNLFLEKVGGGLVCATFSAMILDAAYHFTTGSLLSFVGHDSTEILFHALTYYGMASLVAARFLLKQTADSRL